MMEQHPQPAGKLMISLNVQYKYTYTSSPKPLKGHASLDKSSEIPNDVQLKTDVSTYAKITERNRCFSFSKLHLETKW